jgi:hypothetical protein
MNLRAPFRVLEPAWRVQRRFRNADSAMLNRHLPWKQTPLYELHVAAGAKIVPFAGWEMPLHYRTGAVAEHNHTRQAASMFDVSHMQQVVSVLA